MIRAEGGIEGFVHLEVTRIAAATPKAVRVTTEDCPDGVWIPRSVIADGDEFYPGEADCTLSVQEWFAKKEGWIID